MMTGSLTKHASTFRPALITVGAIGVVLIAPRATLGQLFEQPHEAITAHINQSRPVVADVDGDGDEDILLGNGGPSLMRNDGTGNYETEPIDINISNDGIFELGAGDLDDDGDVDLFVVHQSIPEWGPAWWGVMLNDGTGAFAQPIATTYPYAEFGPVCVRDLNDDGDLDAMVVGGFLNNTVTVFGNLGNGTFNQGNTYTLGPSSGSLQGFDCADIDGDGDPDVASGYFNSGDPAEVAIIRNNGNGSFAAPEVMTLLTTEAQAVKLEDLDGDGDRELIVVDPNEFESSVTIYRNDGNGNYVVPEMMPTLGLAWDVVAGDLDDDGDADLAVTGDVEFGGFPVARVFVHLNDGDGTFTDDQGYDVANTAFDIAFTDADQDGDLDILTSAGGTNDKLSLLRHIDTSPCDLSGDDVIGFADLTILLNAWGACPASCLADLDGDGSVGFSDLTTLLNAWGGCL